MVVTRKDPSGVLLFDIPSDEMYLVSPLGNAIFSLCAGGMTVGEILAQINAKMDEEVLMEKELTTYLTELESRGLVVMWEV